MSSMCRPPAPLPLTELYHGWDKPKNTWMDYFLNPKLLAELFEDVQKNAEQIKDLALQFAELTITLDREVTATSKRAGVLTDVEERAETDIDLTYNRSKRELFWISAMACFAAIEFDFESLFTETKQNTVIMRFLIEQSRVTLDLEEKLRNFGIFLTARFRLFVHRKMRIKPPAGKPQTNNPMTQEDKGVLAALMHRKALAEVRERLPETIAELEVLLKSTSDMQVPTHEPFVNALIECRERYLSIGLLGLDLTVDGLPKPNFNENLRIIPKSEFLNTIRFDLAAFNMQQKKFDIVIQMLTTLKQSYTYKPASFKLCAFNEAEFNGYLVAFNLPQLRNFEHVKPSAIEEKDFDVESPRRRFWMMRANAQRLNRGAVETAFVEDLAIEITEGTSTSPAAACCSLSSLQRDRLIKALLRLLARARDPARQHALSAALHHMCATVIDFAKLVESIPELKLIGYRPLVEIRPPTLNVTPSPIRFAKDQSPCWTLLSSFDAKDIQAALNVLGDVPMPALFRFPDILSALLNRARPNAFHTILFAKLEQLAMIGNEAKWRDFINQIGGIAPEVVQPPTLAVKETMLVQARILNQRLRSPQWAVSEQALKTNAISVRSILSKNEHDHNTEFMVEIVAFMLNAGHTEFVITQTTQPPPYRMFAQLLTAVTKVMSQQRDVISTFVKVVEQSKVISASHRDRDVELQRRLLHHLIRLLTDQEFIAVTISYFCHLYNRLLYSVKEVALALAFQYRELYRCDVSLDDGHVEYIDECLKTALGVGLNLNPCNPYWLRSSADYQFTKCNSAEALRLYMEVVCAVTEGSFVLPAKDSVIDDLMWHRVRVCLTALGMHTLAGLAAQLISLPTLRAEQYAATANHMRSQHILDACDALAELCFDHQLIETFTDIFEKAEMFNRTDAFQAAATHPALNVNNSTEVQQAEKARRTTRLLRVLAASVFELHR